MQDEEMRNDPEFRRTFEAQDAMLEFLEKNMEELKKMSRFQRNRWWLGVLTVCIGAAMETGGWHATTTTVQTIMNKCLRNPDTPE